MKNVLITGATSGIGKNLAFFLKELGGYNPIILGRNEEKLQSMSKELECEYICYDLSDIDHVSAIFSTLAEKAVKLDGIVHCAGVSPLMRISENDTDIMKNTFAVNLFSFIELCKYYALYGNDCGSIVAVSSVAARVGSYRQTVYGASKAAVEEAVRCIAKELIPRKIRVNCIAPGAVETEMFKKLEAESVGLREKMEKLYPLGMAEPCNISYAIEFLISEKARYVTGRCLDIDCGFFTAK